MKTETTHVMAPYCFHTLQLSHATRVMVQFNKSESCVFARSTFNLVQLRVDHWLPARRLKFSDINAQRHPRQKKEHLYLVNTVCKQIDTPPLAELSGLNISIITMLH